MAKTMKTYYLDSTLVTAFNDIIAHGQRSAYVEGALLYNLFMDAKRRKDVACMERLAKIAKVFKNKDAKQQAKEQRAIELRAKIFKEPFG